MKAAVFSLLLLSLLCIVSAKNNNANLEVYDFKSKLTSILTSLKETQKEPAYTYLLQFIQYVILGPSNNSSQNIFDLIQEAPDEIDLFSMIGFASQAFYPFWTENGYDEDGFEELWQGWVEILGVLYSEGAQGVTLGQLKPYIDLLRPENLFEVWKKVNKGNDNLQNYIQNEFLAPIKTKECRDYVGLWFQDIQKGKYWALSMFDNIGKPPTGLLNGNINWLGSYKLCRDVAVDYGKVELFHGRYCRTTLGFPLDALPDVGIPVTDAIALNIGICVPHQCTGEDVEIITNQTLKLLAVYQLLTVKKVTCDYPETPYPKVFIIFTCILSVICILVIFATIFDCMHRAFQPEIVKQEESKETIDQKKRLTGSGVVNEQQYVAVKPTRKSPLVSFALNCSLYTNSERIFRTDNGGKFTCLNGLRALSMIWIIFGHSFNYLADYKLFFLMSNLREAKDLEEKPIAQLIFSAMYGVDTFFIMSAFLLTYSLLNKFEKHNGMTAFEWVYYYVHRYWRLLPPYMIAFIIYIFIMPYVGNGPLWDPNNFPSSNDDCKNYWWAYVLMIQNFVPNGNGVTCMGYLWYVPNDFQLYCLSPIFIIVLFKFPIAGFVLLTFTLISSTTIMAFLTENVYSRNNKIILTTLQSIWGDVYIKPYCRAGPWIVGIILGYVFYKYKKITISQNKALRYVLLSVGWITSIIFALTAVLGNYTNHDPHGKPMEITEFGAYFSITRVTYALSIAWVIFACHYGFGGLINRFLSASAWISLTRISYVSYLIHPLIMNAYFYSQEALFHGSGLTYIYLLVGNIVFTFFVAFLFTMFFEAPFIALEKLLMSVMGKKDNGD